MASPTMKSFRASNDYQYILDYNLYYGFFPIILDIYQGIRKEQLISFIFINTLCQIAHYNYKKKIDKYD